MMPLENSPCCHHTARRGIPNHAITTQHVMLSLHNTMLPHNEQAGTYLGITRPRNCINLVSQVRKPLFRFCFHVQRFVAAKSFWQWNLENRPSDPLLNAHRCTVQTQDPKRRRAKTHRSRRHALTQTAYSFYMCTQGNTQTDTSEHCRQLEARVDDNDTADKTDTIVRDEVRRIFQCRGDQVHD